MMYLKTIVVRCKKRRAKSLLFIVVYVCDFSGAVDSVLIYEEEGTYYEAYFCYFVFVLSCRRHRYPMLAFYALPASDEHSICSK